MRVAACGLILAAGSAVAAAPPVTNFDPVVFEQRFNKADKGKKGKLSRAEAYAEFPRMPEFFDEIDSDKDNFITLAEVRRAIDRRVNAAMDTANSAKRYGGVDAGGATSAGTPRAPAQPKQFSSATEARRYHQRETYEAIAGSKALARERGEPVSNSPETPVFKKSF